MSKDDFGDKLDKTYISMLNAVEDLVAKEGKNIKEAFAGAEEKISEWGELGREEASSISDEVQQDLSQLGETIEEAKKSFRQKWELDSKYFSDTVWNTLSSVADKTTVALNEFREELKEKTEEATKDLHEREHKDHRQWHSDHEMWLDDIAIWRKEYAEAEQSLKEMQEKISKLDEQLEEHAKAISTHDYIDKVHEKDIARSEQDPDNPVLDVINNGNDEAYQDMKKRHENEVADHQKYKDEYRSMMILMAKFNKLA